MNKNNHSNASSTVTPCHYNRKLKRRYTYCGDVYATSKRSDPYNGTQNSANEYEYVKKPEGDFSQRKRMSECRTEHTYFQEPPEFKASLMEKPMNKSPYSARQSIIKIEYPTRMKSRSDPVFDCGSFLDKQFYFEPCQAFQQEGVCFKGSECPYIHNEQNRPFGKVAVKLLQILEKSVSENESKSIGDVLDSTEKYGRYLSVFKQIVYRYDKNDLFPAF